MRDTCAKWFTWSAGLGLLLAAPAVGQPPITFQNVVDTKGTFSGLQFSEIGPFPGINHAGQIAFVGTTTSGMQGVFLAHTATGSITTLIDDSGPYADFSATFVNNAGVAAVHAERDDGERAILAVSAAGGAVPVVDSTGALDRWQIPADINNAGTIVFHGTFDTDAKAVLTATAATPLNTVEIVDDAHAAYFLPLVNNAGDVVFFGATSGEGELTIDSPGGMRETVATTNSTTGPLTGAIPFHFNDHGDTVFVATEVSGARSIRLYQAATGMVDEIVGPSTGFTFTGIPEPAINNRGQVVFDVGGAGSTPHYLTDSGPIPLISAGDPLFGSTILLGSMGKAFNDAGQLAMVYGLQDGTVGIALVTVPEPATSLLLLVLLVAWRTARRSHVRVGRAC